MSTKIIKTNPTFIICGKALSNVFTSFFISSHDFMTRKMRAMRKRRTILTTPPTSVDDTFGSLTIYPANVPITMMKSKRFQPSHQYCVQPMPPIFSTASTPKMIAKIRLSTSSNAIKPVGAP